MSPRNNVEGPGREPLSTATTELVACPRVTSKPNPSKPSSTALWVSGSSRPSSGCLWIRRRISTISGSRPRASSRSPAGTVTPPGCSAIGPPRSIGTHHGRRIGERGIGELACVEEPGCCGRSLIRSQSASRPGAPRVDASCAMLARATKEMPVRRRTLVRWRLGGALVGLCLIVPGEAMAGSTGALAQSPRSTVSYTLNSIVCVSTSRCWAVGYDGSTVFNYVPLAERWKSGKWTSVTVPPSSGEPSNSLGGVACVFELPSAGQSALLCRRSSTPQLSWSCGTATSGPPIRNRMPAGSAASPASLNPTAGQSARTSTVTALMPRTPSVGRRATRARTGQRGSSPSRLGRGRAV